MEKEKKISIKNINAAIFDLDGVVTDTASVHAKAWKQLFDFYLNDKEKEYTPMDIVGDYNKYIDGKPRYKGVQSFLKSRNIDIPYGDPDDGPEKETVCGLGNRKNEIFQKLLDEEGFEVYEDAVSQIKKWKSEGIKTAIISSSKNCKKILDLAELNDLFDERVDGILSEKLNLNGKPSPDIFNEAANRLEVPPERTVIFEDAIAGVEAGKKGNFNCVIGVERNGGNGKLKKYGANKTVTSFWEIDLLKESKPGKLPISKIPSALDHYQEICNQFSSKKMVLFLDYDGTLTPIVKDAEKAKLSGELRSIIKKLSDYCTVAVVSGRDLTDIKEKISLQDINYAGCHGLEISGPDVQYIVGEEAIPQIDQAKKEIQQKLDTIEGTKLERKKLIVAAHYRQAKEKGEEIRRFVNELAEKYDKLRVEENKKVIELRPDVDWHKGKAIEYLLQELDLDDPDALPVFIGDDITDEDGFRYLHPKGIGIVVGDHGKHSYAKYKLQNHEEVKKFLYQLEDILIKEPAYNWKVVYQNYIPEQEPLREALCTLGNGYFATRGAAEETNDEGAHYPGTYLAGGYNRAETEISGKIIENEDLVNWPNWLCLTFRIENEDWFHIDSVEISDYQQLVDLKKGILERRVRFRDHKDRETELISKRFVSQKDAHIAGLEWTLEPRNWSGKIEIKTAINGKVINNGVERYRDLNSHHLRPVSSGKVGEKSIYLLTQTKQSLIYLAQAVRTEVFSDKRPIAAERKTHLEEDYVEQVIRFNIEKLKPVRVEKILSLFTSRDVGISDPLTEAKKEITRADTFEELLLTHIEGWKELWYRFNITINNSKEDQMVLRLHIFHLLQTVSFKSIDLDVGVPSRGWHGEAYRGHIFWDEIFIFPFLNLRVPELTRSLLMYRYHRLGEARYAAKKRGYKGAMFPWQSGSNGREESQILHLNPQSDQWIPDNTYLQRHISADIVFNIMEYYEATNDKEFLNFYGAEIILDVANFFSSITEWSDKKQRYEICNVAGPDEYHTQYPSLDKSGINNNAYTNIMASWVLQTACRLTKDLESFRREELMINLNITEEDLIRWDKVARKMYVPFINDRIINQFEGYDNLEELEWDKYREQYGEFLRLDRILQAEGDDVNRYKASKQADVLMLFYLFTTEELQEIFDHLGYSFEPEMIPENIEYYVQRTSHGSTLSQLVHSWVFARSDRKTSWHSFRKALMSDFKDVQGGTTPEGIHLGAMAGTVDLIQRCYTGITMSKGTLWINPQLPENLQEIILRVRYRTQWLKIRVNHKKLHIQIEEGWVDTISVGFKNRIYTMTTGDKKTFYLDKG